MSGSEPSLRVANRNPREATVVYAKHVTLKRTITRCKSATLRNWPILLCLTSVELFYYYFPFIYLGCLYLLLFIVIGVLVGKCGKTEDWGRTWVRVLLRDQTRKSGFDALRRRPCCFLGSLCVSQSGSVQERFGRTRLKSFGSWFRDRGSDQSNQVRVWCFWLDWSVRCGVLVVVLVCRLFDVTLSTLFICICGVMGLVLVWKVV